MATVLSAKILKYRAEGFHKTFPLKTFPHLNIENKYFSHAFNLTLYNVTKFLTEKNI